jgi:O-antigen ligase
MFLFLAVAFFLCNHDLYLSKKGIDAFNPSEADLVAGVDAHSLIRRIAFLSLGLFAVASLIRHRGARLRIRGSLGWTMLFLVGWAVLSLAWAEEPALTLRRLEAFGILCIAAAALARRCSLRETVLLTFYCSLLFLVIGVSAEILLGTFRPFTPGYRFAGTLHPNGQGINCALLLLAGIAAGDTEKHRRTVFRASALLGLLFLILTASRTGFAAAIVALAVYLAAVCSRRAKTVLGLGVGIAFCSLLLVLGNALLPDLRSTLNLGRDDSTVGSLNGRTGVWEECRHYIDRRPLVGYGFGSFWTQRHITEISATQKWGVAQAHSAYLECLVDLGLVGLAAYVFALLGGIARSFAFHRASQAPAFAFSGAFLTFCLVDGLLDSAVLVSMQLIFLTAAVLIELAFRRHEFGFRRYLSYVLSRNYGCGLHLQQSRDASKRVAKPHASTN